MFCVLCTHCSTSDQYTHTAQCCVHMSACVRAWIWVSYKIQFMYPRRQQCRYNLQCTLVRSLTHSLTLSLARLLGRSHALVRLVSILFSLLLFFAVDFFYNILSIHILIHCSAVFVTILFHLYSVSSSNFFLVVVNVVVGTHIRILLCCSFSPFSLLFFSLLLHYFFISINRSRIYFHTFEMDFFDVFSVWCAIKFR